MTLRELNQLRRLRREIRLLENYIAKYDAVLYPKAAEYRRYRQVPPEEDARRIKAAKRRIEENRAKCLAEAERLEAWISGVDDSLTRAAMRLRFIDGLGWTAVALKLGGGNTEDSVKKMVYRYIRRTSGTSDGSCPDA